MKKIIILIVSFVCASCSAQRLEGLFFDNQSTSFACIKKDSIAIVYKRSEWDGPCYYYGNFNRIHDTIVLDKNLLRHDNAIVETLHTDYLGIEIQFYELYPDIPLGAPVEQFSTFYQLAKNCCVWWNYESDKRLLFWRNQPNAKTTDGLIQIPMETALNECSDNNEFLIKGYSIFTEQILELKPNTRYVIKQKNYNQTIRPMVPQEVPVVFNKKKNQIEITENSTINDEPFRTFQLKYVGKVDSCLGELRKRYPDL